MSEIENLKNQVRTNENAAVIERIVAKGHKPVKQIIIKPVLDAAGNVVKAGRSYFCETPEQQEIFKANNPGVEIESYNIELLKSTADSYLNDPENRKQFTRKF